MNATTVTGVAAVTTDLLAAVPPGAAGAPTPCTDWNVADLAGHIRQVLSALDLIGQGRPLPHDHWKVAAATTALGGDWSHPHGTADLGGMTMPAGQAVAMLVSDLVLHGWDLSRALGRTVSWDSSAVEATLDFLVAMVPQGRAMGIFGPEIPVGPGVTPLERALGLSGRNPAWNGGDE